MGKNKWSLTSTFCNPLFAAVQKGGISVRIAPASGQNLPARFLPTWRQVRERHLGLAGAIDETGVQSAWLGVPAALPDFGDRQPGEAPITLHSLGLRQL